eukprot:scaffold7066_cov253-Pinguiococcus_pyrenoidosus.AAC.50
MKKTDSTAVVASSVSPACGAHQISFRRAGGVGLRGSTHLPKPDAEHDASEELGRVLGHVQERPPRENDRLLKPAARVSPFVIHLEEGSGGLGRRGLACRLARRHLRAGEAAPCGQVACVIRGLSRVVLEDLLQDVIVLQPPHIRICCVVSSVDGQAVLQPEVLFRLVDPAVVHHSALGKENASLKHAEDPDARLVNRADHEPVVHGEMREDLHHVLRHFRIQAYHGGVAV